MAAPNLIALVGSQRPSLGQSAGFLETESDGTETFIQRADGTYWKVIQFPADGSLTITGTGSADYLVAGGGGNGGQTPGEIEKSVTGETGDTGAALDLSDGVVAVTVGAQGAAGVAGGASEVGTVSAAGGSAS